MEQKQSYFKLTNYGYSSMGLYKHDIRNKFPDNPICFVEYYEKMELGNIVEVRLIEENVTSTCTFNKENACNSVYLFFDEHSDIMNYIEFIKNNFTYDYLGCRWLLHNCFMAVKKIDGITCFMFYR